MIHEQEEQEIFYTMVPWCSYFLLNLFLAFGSPITPWQSIHRLRLQTNLIVTIAFSATDNEGLSFLTIDLAFCPNQFLQ